jgi:hypothetical protein
MATEFAPAVTTKATVAHVRRVMEEVLTVYLFSIGKNFPLQRPFTVNLANDLHLPPVGRDLERICIRLSEVLFCEKPSVETRAEWSEFLDGKRVAALMPAEVQESQQSQRSSL